MAEAKTSFKEQEATEVVRKSDEQEENGVIGCFLEQVVTDDEDSGGTTCSAGEDRYPGWPGTNVFRMLIPAQMVGALIGHKGDRVRRLCEETKACVRVIGGHLGAPEQAVIIFAKEHPGAPIPPAMDALLRVHQHTINDVGLDVESNSMIVTRILTPSEQAASLIGKQGAMINSIKEASHTNIRVLDGGLPPVALEEDRVIEIRGLPAGVHKALELVASHLRKYLVHRSVIPLFDPHTPMPILHMGMSPCHYSDHPEGPLHAVSPGCYSVYAEDRQCESLWSDTLYSRCTHPMEKLIHADTFEYRRESPTCFGGYSSVTPPHHGIGAYGQEASSSFPMGGYLSAPMELCPLHNITYGRRATPPIGPSAAVERIRSLISVYGQQAHPGRQTYQSAKIGKHPHFGVSLYGSEAHPTRVSPSAATELPPITGITACGQEASPSLRMYRPATMENTLHCGMSMCGQESSPNVGVPSLATQSPAVTSQIMKKLHVPIFYAEAVIGPTGARIDYIRRASRSAIKIKDIEESAMSIEITGSAATDVQTAEQLIKNFMAEAAAASPGHNYDFIPSYLPAPKSTGVDILTTSHTSGVCSLTEQRLQMIY